MTIGFNYLSPAERLYQLWQEFKKTHDWTKYYQWPKMDKEKMVKEWIKKRW